LIFPFSQALQQAIEDDSAIDRARLRVAELEARRLQLEKELNRLRNQAMDTESIAGTCSFFEHPR